MPPKDTPIKQDFVSSIFSRQPKKEGASSLFLAGKSNRDKALPDTASEQAIRKRLPLGLDIGTNFIKAVQLGVTSGGTVKIINWVIEELPRGASENPGENLKIISEALKRIVGERGLKGDCFSLAPFNSVGINLIRLPMMPPNEIDDALLWEIRQTTPRDISEISLDYILLDPQRLKFLGSQVGALAITAVKKNIFEHLALLESAGLNPLALDVEQLADIALLDYTHQIGPTEVVPFLNFGAGKSCLSIICNQQLVSTRLINITGNSLTKAVSDYCGVSLAEAESLKKKFDINLTGEKDQQLKNTVVPLLENIVQDIEHTFKYFSYQITQSQVTRFDKMILAGGSSAIKGLDSFLSNRLNIEVSIINPLSSFGPLGQGFGEAENLGPQLSVALGLALRGIE